jgi:hypothetical protein
MTPPAVVFQCEPASVARRSSGKISEGLVLHQVAHLGAVVDGQRRAVAAMDELASGTLPKAQAMKFTTASSVFEYRGGIMMISRLHSPLNTRIKRVADHGVVLGPAPEKPLRCRNIQRENENRSSRAQPTAARRSAG